MNERHSRRRIRASRMVCGWIVAACAAFILCPAASAADLWPGWGRWWLPPDRSVHGWAMDALFNWIFWITMIIFIVVEIVLIVFLIKYRYRPDRKKAHFTHGNTRLEMTWTVAPAIILALLALFSKKAWDMFRYSPDLQDPNRAKVLVIGERFKWNVIYPGPDGKFGRYLVYPRPTDIEWPVGEGGKAPTFSGVRGPASLPYKDAVNAITNYILTENPLGKDFTDPDGKDDNWEKQPGRPIEIPVKRPVEVVLGSKDVLHAFFLPNYRVKLDAVAGMRGRFTFTATMTSKELEKASRRKYTVPELQQIFSSQPLSEYVAIITETEHTQGAEDYKPQRGPRFWRYKDAENKTIVRDGGQITAENLVKLKEAGVTEIFANEPGYWDLVCEELCGEGHATMKGQLIVLTQEEFNAKKLDLIPGGVPSSVARTAAR